MYKALIWKEYRETRMSQAAVVLCFCAIITLVLIFKDHRYSVLISSGLAELAGLPMMFYTLMAGAETFASEYQLKTFDFLESRTITRSRIWLFKLVLRLSILVIPVIVYLFTIKTATDTARATLISNPSFVMTSLILLLFSTSFFFSTIFNRPFKAGISGSIVCLGFGMPFFYIFEDYFTFTINETYFAFAIFCIPLSILILIASYVIFTNGRYPYAM